MATLWIREYSALPNPTTSGLGAALGGGAPMAQEPGTDQTPVTFVTSTQSAAFAASTVFIAIYGSAAFHYVVGANPAATTSALKVAADTLIYVGVIPGQKIAAIAAA